MVWIDFEIYIFSLHSRYYYQVCKLLRFNIFLRSTHFFNFIFITIFFLYVILLVSSCVIDAKKKK